MHGRIRLILRDLEGNVLQEEVIDNLVVSAAKNAFASILNNEGTSTGIINYGAVGTGANSPTLGDTTLQAEIERVTIDSQSRAGNVTTISFAYSPTQAIGTLKEFGAFIDGTAAVDTGTLFDRVNIDVVKTANNTLTIELQITVN